MCYDSGTGGSSNHSSGDEGLWRTQLPFLEDWMKRSPLAHCLVVTQLDVGELEELENRVSRKIQLVYLSLFPCLRLKIVVGVSGCVQM